MSADQKAFEAEARALHSGGLQTGKLETGGLRTGSLNDRPKAHISLKDQLGKMVGDGVDLIHPYIVAKPGARRSTSTAGGAEYVDFWRNGILIRRQVLVRGTATVDLNLA